MPNTIVPVSGLTCRRCVETVTEEISTIAGVTSVSVDLTTGGVSTVTVQADQELTDEAIQQALNNGGAFTISR